MKDIIFMSLDVVNLLVEVTGVPFLNHIPVEKYPFNRIIVSMTDPTRLSGFQNNLNMSDEDDTPEFRASKGTYLKPSRLIKVFLEAQEVQSSDQEILNYAQKLAELLRDRAAGDLKLPIEYEIKVTDTPSKVYGMDYVAGGNLGSSCMNGQDPEMFELYDISPNIECVYVVNASGKLVGRTLVAKNVVMDEEIVSVAFRLYFANSMVQAFLKSWLLGNGYYVPSVDGYVSEAFINPETSHLVRPEKMYFDTEIDMTDLHKVPYVDQFQDVYHESQQTFYLVWPRHTYRDPGRYLTSLARTDGSDDEGVLCETRSRGNCTSCGDLIEEDDDYSYVDGDILCEDCRNNEAFFCEGCDEWHYDNNAISVNTDSYSEMVCEECVSDCAFQCDCCGDWFFDDLEVSVDGDSVCPNCFDDMETFSCTKCGSYNSVTSEQCHSCGEKFFECSECGALNTKNSEQCHSCGEKFFECSECGALNTKNSEQCHSCGEKFFECSECGALNTKNSEQCHSCGEEFFECSECGNPNTKNSEQCWDCWKPLKMVTEEPCNQAA